MAKCPVCGGTDCPTVQEIERRSNIGDFAGAEALERRIMQAKQALGGPLGLLALLAGGLPGMEVETEISTAMIDAETGEVKFRRSGSRLEPVSLKGIDPEIIADLQKIVDFDISIEKKRREAVRLRHEASNLREEVRRAKIRLKHAIWAEYPERYGEDGLYLEDEDGTIALFDDDRNRLSTVKGNQAKSLLAQQAEIKAKQDTVRENEATAEKLNQEVEHEPELLAVQKKDAFDRLKQFLRESNPELDLQLATGQAFITVDEDGKIQIMARRQIDEESDQMPAEDLELLRLIHRRDGRRGRSLKDRLPKGLARLLGISQEEKPALEDHQKETEKAADHVGADT